MKARLLNPTNICAPCRPRLWSKEKESAETVSANIRALGAEADEQDGDRQNRVCLLLALSPLPNDKQLFRGSVSFRLGATAMLCALFSCRLGLFPLSLGVAGGSRLPSGPTAAHASRHSMARLLFPSLIRPARHCTIRVGPS